MSGVSITVDLGASAVASVLERFAASVRDVASVLADVGVGLEESTRYRFEDGSGPDGQAWLAPRHRSGQPLVDHGHLRDSITSVVEGGDTVVIGSNAVYAAIHQFGGVIEAKNAPKLAFHVGGHLVMVDSVEIPARPFLGVDDADEAMILDLFEAHLGSTWEASHGH